MKRSLLCCTFFMNSITGHSSTNQKCTSPNYDLQKIVGTWYCTVVQSLDGRQLVPYLTHIQENVSMHVRVVQVLVGTTVRVMFVLHSVKEG